MPAFRGLCGWACEVVGGGGEGVWFFHGFEFMVLRYVVE